MRGNKSNRGKSYGKKRSWKARFSSQIQASTYGALLASIGLSGAVWADHKVFVTTSDGQRPYMLVLPETPKETGSDHGIYVADEKGKWNRVFPGGILTGRTVQGVLASLETTHIDHRFTSVAVIDGKITLFSIATREDQPDSSIVLGSPNYPFLDILHNAELPVSDIDSVDDIHVQLGGLTDRGQLVLGSVRLKVPSLQGDGLTFAIYVRTGKEGATTIDLAGPPLVLDYRFRNPSELKRLAESAYEKTGVYSETLLRSLTRIGKKDPEAVIRWKEELTTDLATLGSMPLEKSVPYYDMLKGEAIIPSPVVLNIGRITQQCYQIYDPHHGLDGIMLSSTNPGRGVPGASKIKLHRLGRIDFDGSSNRPMFFTNSTESSVALAYIQRELTLIIDKEDKPYFLPLKTAAEELPTDFSYTVRFDQEAGKDPRYLIILSHRTKTKAKTEYLVVRKSGLGYEIAKNYDINDTYYPSTELAARTHYSPGTLLFDTLTPKQKSAEAYQQLVAPTIPYLDLTKSSDAHMNPVQTYRQALEEIEVSPFAVHRVYDPRGARFDHTGLTVHDNKNREVRTVRGTLLRRRGDEKAELGSRAIKVNRADSNSRISLVALDAGMQDGESGFTLAAVAAYGGYVSSSQSYATPAVIDATFAPAFSQLAGIYWLSGGNKLSDTLHLLLRFDPTENEKSEYKQGGVMVLTLKTTLKTDRDDNSSYSIEKLKEQWLIKSHISEGELQSRLLRDNVEGKLHFITKPEIDPGASNYSLIELYNGKEIFPNSQTERNRKFVAEESSPDSVTHLGNQNANQAAAWEVYSPHRMRERFSEGSLKGFLDKDHPDITEQGLNTFPKIREVLDSIANSQDKPGRRVFIVPEHLKGEFLRTAAFLMADRDAPRAHWTFKNPRFKFYLFDRSKASQGEMADNFLAMQKIASQMKVSFFADGNDVIKVNRPESSEPGDDNNRDLSFKLEIPGEEGEEPHLTTPHALYWMATEGERLQPARAAERGLKDPNVDYSIVATPSEWREMVAQAKTEKKLGILDGFKVDTTFMHGSWKVWPAGTPKAKERITRLAQAPFSEFENEVFPSLAQMLSEAADPTKPAKHRIVVVPQELKGNVTKLILSRWVHGKDARDGWRQNNPDLSMYWLDSNTKSQDEILENLDALRLAPSTTRGVVVADMADVSKLGRTADTDSDSFYLKELEVDDEQHASSASHDVRVGEARVFPHLLYLLGTEGRRLQLEEFRKDQQPLRTSQILIGTESEWRGLQQELSPEDRVGLADRFERVELPVPSVTVRKQMLRRVLERPEISGLRYRFDAKGVREVEPDENPTAEEIMDSVLGYMVTRCELLAGKDVIPSFVKLLNTFHVSLVKDEVLRRRQVIDRIFVERLFSKIFDMPLNLAVLPPDDPLKKLSRQDAAMELQQAGYEGPIEFKTRVIQTILAQTRPDPIRPIPSSVILFGDTRSGKTFLFKTLCKMLGLRMYDYARPTETSAQAMIINVGKLRPNGKDDKAQDIAQPVHTETMTVDTALRHLHNFLSLPNGYRGFLLLDDVHLASDEVRAQIITTLRSLFEAGGTYKVRGTDGKYIEITTRNLTIMMTVNPPDDVEKLKKYVRTGDDVERVIASLAGKDVNVDRSFIERWGTVLNLSLFPAEAKAPKLRDSVREAARDAFNNQNKLVLVSPTAIQLVAQSFKDENASFLSKATPGLIGRSSEYSEQSALSIVVPRRGQPQRGHTADRPSWEEASGRSGSEIEGFIQDSTVALPVVGRLDGQFEMLRLLVDTFRAQVFENFVRALGQDGWYAGTVKQQRQLLSPMLHSVTAHLWTHPNLPVNTLNLDPYAFSAKTALQRERFQRLVETHSEGIQKYFPVRFGDELPAHGLLRALTDYTFQGADQRNRAHVLTEHVDMLKPKLQKLLESFLRVDSIDTLPSAQDWLHSLPAYDNNTANAQLGQALADQFRDFYDNLFAEGLTENLDAASFAEISTYDAARLFMLVVDKTITKMPWATALHFLVDGLDLASRHMELGQLPGVQHYVFASKFSAVRPTNHDLVIQLASNSDTYRRTDTGASQRMAQIFDVKCSQLLVQTIRDGE